MQTSGALGGTVQVTNALASGDLATLPLTAIDMATTALVVAPSTLDFGKLAVGTSSAPLVITVSNNGGCPKLHAIVVELLGSNVNDFAIQANDCVEPASGEHCNVAARFVPGQTGAATAMLKVYAGGERAVVSLTGQTP